jgi:hypothetical protein
MANVFTGRNKNTDALSAGSKYFLSRRSKLQSYIGRTWQFGETEKNSERSYTLQPVTLAILKPQTSTG